MMEARRRRTMNSTERKDQLAITVLTVLMVVALCVTSTGCTSDAEAKVASVEQATEAVAETVEPTQEAPAAAEVEVTGEDGAEPAEPQVDLWTRICNRFRKDKAETDTSDDTLGLSDVTVEAKELYEASTRLLEQTRELNEAVTDLNAALAPSCEQLTIYRCTNGCEDADNVAFDYN
jgi:hypothetical protein